MQSVTVRRAYAFNVAVLIGAFVKAMKEWGSSGVCVQVPSSCVLLPSADLRVSLRKVGAGRGNIDFWLKAAKCSWTRFGEFDLQQPGNGRAAVSLRGGCRCACPPPTRARDLCLLHNSANYCPGAALAAICYGSQLKPVQDRAEDEAPVRKLVRLLIISVPFLSSKRKGSLVHQSHLVQPVCDVRFCCLLAFFSTLGKSRQRCFEVKPSTLKSYPREQEQFDSKSR